MNSSLQIQQVENKILSIRGEKVLLDSDVAAFYEVETRVINQAVQRNPDKFPEGYIIQLGKEEWIALRSKILTLNEESESVTDGDGSECLKSQIVTSNEEGKNSDKSEFLRSQIVILGKLGQGQYSKYLPKAFTEKGLYMLATILKGDKATATTLAIVETFTKIRELSRTVEELAKVPDEAKQKTLMQKGGEIMADLIGDRKSTRLNSSH